jgi:hypothetical protein
MPYLIRGADFLPRRGYATIIVAGPISRGRATTVECHSFYSGKADTYELFAHSYTSVASEELGDEPLIDAATKLGEERLYSVLREASAIQYEAMLLGFGFAFHAKDKSYLLRLHCQNLLSAEIEERIIQNTQDAELKSFMDTVNKLGRVTSVKRI